MMSCLTPDIHNPISPAREPAVRILMWIDDAASRLRDSIACERATSCSTIGSGRSSQFRASNREPRRRSVSSTIRFCCGGVVCRNRSTSAVNILYIGCAEAGMCDRSPDGYLLAGAATFAAGGGGAGDDVPACAFGGGGGALEVGGGPYCPGPGAGRGGPCGPVAWRLGPNGDMTRSVGGIGGGYCPGPGRP